MRSGSSAPPLTSPRAAGSARMASSTCARRSGSTPSSPPRRSCPRHHAVYFWDWQWAEWGTDARTRQALDRTYRAQATNLLGGLAARFGGIAYAQPDEITKPVRADVYTVLRRDAAELESLASRYAPGLAPADSSGPDGGVITLRGNGAPLTVEYWPPRVASLARLESRAADAGPPAVLGDQWRGDDVAMIVVRAGQPAEGAEPGVARAVGQAALGLAHGGQCLDLFGFRVRQPDDLVVR
jgi:hypothetical protein